MSHAVIDIYLAGPYSDPDQRLQEFRYDALTETFARLCKGGFTCYSPITQCHVAALRHGMPSDCFYWAKTNRSFLIACRELWVLTLPGWMESRGVQEEIKWATSLGMPIVHLDTPHAHPECIRPGDYFCQGDGFLPSIALDRISR